MSAFHPKPAVAPCLTRGRAALRRGALPRSKAGPRIACAATGMEKVGVRAATLDKTNHIGYMPARNGCGGRLALRFSPPLDGRRGRAGFGGGSLKATPTSSDATDRMIGARIPGHAMPHTSGRLPRATPAPRWRGIISRAGNGRAREPAPPPSADRRSWVEPVAPRLGAVAVRLFHRPPPVRP